MMQNTQSIRQQGFTLVEIMVVVVILGLLATVGTVAFTRNLRSAQNDTAKTKCAEYQRAIEAYVIQNARDDIPAEDVFERMIEERVIKSRRDLQDPWGEPYQVMQDEDGEYIVFSKGRDKQAETDDDIYRDGIASERDTEDF